VFVLTLKVSGVRKHPHTFVRSHTRVRSASLLVAHLNGEWEASACTPIDDAPAHSAVREDGSWVVCTSHELLLRAREMMRAFQVRKVHSLPSRPLCVRWYRTWACRCCPATLAGLVAVATPAGGRGKMVGQQDAPSKSGKDTVVQGVRVPVVAHRLVSPISLVLSDVADVPLHHLRGRGESGEGGA
jgi:hypothetical protein